MNPWDTFIKDATNQSQDFGEMNDAEKRQYKIQQINSKINETQREINRINVSDPLERLIRPNLQQKIADLTRKRDRIYRSYAKQG
jgi:hypothetical protein